MKRALISIFASMSLSLTACAVGTNDPNGIPRDPADENDELVDALDVDSADIDAIDEVTPNDLETPPHASAPEPNGKHIVEESACAAIADTLLSKAGALGCAMKVEPCPDLIRRMSGETCVHYDEGSVERCVDQLKEAPTCGRLDHALENCELVVFPGSVSPHCQ
jgi:hypothetical protein